MIDFDTLCQDCDVKYTNERREWKFRRFEDLMPAEAKMIGDEVKAMGADGASDVDQYVRMLSLLSPDDCRATDDEIASGLRIKEIRAIISEVSKPTSLGE